MILIINACTTGSKKSTDVVQKKPNKILLSSASDILQWINKQKKENKNTEKNSQKNVSKSADELFSNKKYSVLIQNFLQKKPENFHTEQLLIRSLLVQNKIDLAKKRLENLKNNQEKTTKKNKKIINYLTIFIHLKVQQYKRAKQKTQKHLKSYPFDDYGLFLLSQIYLCTRNFIGVEYILKVWKEEKPLSRPLRRLVIGLLFQQNGKDEKAKTIFTQLQTAHPSTFLLTKLGLLAFKQKHYKASRKVFVKILKQDPYHEEAFLGLAETEKALGNTEDAKKYLQKTLKINPFNFYARLELGILSMEVFQEYLEAKRLFLEVTESSIVANPLKKIASAYLLELSNRGWK